MSNPSLREALLSCIETCSDCAVACENCASACLSEVDVLQLTRCIRLDLDCAELCRATAALLARDSEFSDAMIELCADACEACAQECDRHEHMEHCADCAHLCRRCAAKCRGLVGAQLHHIPRDGIEASAH